MLPSLSLDLLQNTPPPPPPPSYWSGLVFIFASFLKTHFRDICQVAGKHYACFSNKIYACNALTKHPHLRLYTCVECVSGLLIWNKTSVTLLQYKQHMEISIKTTQIQQSRPSAHGIRTKQLKHTKNRFSSDLQYVILSAFILNSLLNMS